MNVSAEQRRIREWRSRGNQLLTAARKGLVSDVARLVHEDPSLLSYPDTKHRTALHRACIKGHVEAATILLEAGAEVDARDDEGSTALHHAAHQDHVEVVKVLIAHGANVEAVTADDNATPLYFAALGDSEQCAALLLKHGANPNAVTREGGTPLHVTNNGALVEMLIRSGADVNKSNPDGSTPLHTAVLNNWTVGAKVLIEHGADVNAAECETPLGCAAENCNLELCNLLVESGANLSWGEISYYDTPAGTTAVSIVRSVLSKAVKSQHDDAQLIPCLQVLLSHGADVNQVDLDKGTTALHYAAIRSTTDVLQILLDHGARFDILDENALGALDWALGVTPPRATAAPRRRPALTDCALVLLRRGAQVSAAAVASHGKDIIPLLQGARDLQQAQERPLDVSVDVSDALSIPQPAQQAPANPPGAGPDITTNSESPNLTPSESTENVPASPVRVDQTEKQSLVWPKMLLASGVAVVAAVGVAAVWWWKERHTSHHGD